MIDFSKLDWSDWVLVALVLGFLAYSWSGNQEIAPSCVSIGKEVACT